MNLQLLLAKNTDLKLIHELQIKSFKTLLERYKDYSTNPASESLSKIQKRFNENKTTYYLICYNDIYIGAVRLITKNKNTNKISPMFIEPNYQNKHIGQKVISNLELLYPNSTVWELNTIIQEISLCKFYEKMGYVDTGERHNIQDGMDIISYQKIIK